MNIKKLSGLFFSGMLFSMISEAGSVLIYNNDSRSHKVELDCQGRSKTLDVKASQTATYTFHSTSSECKIKGGSVSFPVDKLVSGNNFKFKNSMAYKTW